MLAVAVLLCNQLTTVFADSIYVCTLEDINTCGKCRCVRRFKNTVLSRKNIEILKKSLINFILE